MAAMWRRHGGDAAARRRLDGGLRVAVARETLDVQVVGCEGVTGGVRVLDAGGVRVALGERRLLAQRLRERRVRQRAARVQPLPERVHHADLPNAQPDRLVLLPFVIISSSGSLIIAI